MEKSLISNNIGFLCVSVVGITYILSGSLKLIDPVGTGIIIESYFHLIHVESLVAYSKIAGSCIGLFESFLGVSMLFWGSRNMAVVMFAVQSIFTLLSLALVILNPPMHCGCFGEAIHLTHAQTLLKNFILLSMIVYVWATRKSSPQFLKKGRRFLFAVFLSGICTLTIYSWDNEPLFDFSNAKEGSRLVTIEKYRNLAKDERLRVVSLNMVSPNGAKWPDISNGGWALISVYDYTSIAGRLGRLKSALERYKTLGYNVLLLITPVDNTTYNQAFEEIKESVWLVDKNTAVNLNRVNGGVTIIENGIVKKKGPCV